jgi:hypothetical protein
MNITNIDINWAYLRKQKEWLLKHDNDYADGLIHLLDDIQDAAVESGECTEQEVFGQSLIGDEL